MLIDKNIKKYLDLVTGLGFYDTKKIIETSPTESSLLLNGRRYINFSSNNYLGVSDHPKIKEAILKAANIYGMGSGGSRLMTGNTAVQIELERKIAEFKGRESAITFATGYMANLGVIKAISSPIEFKNNFFASKRVKGEIFSDELNHSSIIEGIKLTNCNKHIYGHLNYKELESYLRKSKAPRKLIISESIYSMDGDIADLTKLVDISKRFEAILMIDDAHGTGVLGSNGKGIEEHFGYKEPVVDILMGTFTKAFGGLGGYITGSKDLIEYIRYSANSYIFTAPIPPVIAAGLCAAIDLIKSEPERIKILWQNVNYYKDLLKEENINYLGSESQIVPIFIGDERETITLAERMNKRGFFVTPVVWPAVAKNQARLRSTITTNLTRKNIESFVHGLSKEIKS